MTHQILSAKLDELESQHSLMYQQLRTAESSPPSELFTQMEQLQSACKQYEQGLQETLAGSHARFLKPLSEAYQTIKDTIFHARQNFFQFGSGPNAEEAAAEEKLLLAEYMLDFAMLASHRALLASLDAIAAQLSQEEKEAENQ